MDEQQSWDDLITRVVREHRDELLEEWLERQLTAETLRLDLIDETALRRESGEFLDALAASLAPGTPVDLDAPEFRPVREGLERLSTSRDERGFSPSETATFVFSFKQPLMERVQKETSSSQALDVLWAVTRLFDRLGLYTMEVYRQRKEATIARQQAEMQELSTPVINLWEGILALPLIGTLDTGRSQMVTSTLLDAIASTGSEIAIIDLTGVPAVDTRMAQYLMRTVAAARLMGAECILSGIRPQIAQTIVHLQINLGDIKTEATLAGALARAFEQSRLRVVAKGG